MASKSPAKTKAAAAPKAAAEKPRKPLMSAVKKPAATTARKATTKTVPKAAPVAATRETAETLKAVFEQLAEAQDMPKKQAVAMATGMVDLVTDILKAGNRVRLSGLGILEVKDRPERMGRNPATGAVMQIAASKKVAFRAAKELKEVV